MVQRDASPHGQIDAEGFPAHCLDLPMQCTPFAQKLVGEHVVGWLVGKLVGWLGSRNLSPADPFDAQFAWRQGRARALPSALPSLAPHVGGEAGDPKAGDPEAGGEAGGPEAFIPEGSVYATAPAGPVVEESQGPAGAAATAAAVAASTAAKAASAAAAAAAAASTSIQGQRPATASTQKDGSAASTATAAASTQAEGPATAAAAASTPSEGPATAAAARTLTVISLNEGGCMVAPPLQGGLWERESLRETRGKWRALICKLG